MIFILRFFFFSLFDFFFLIESIDHVGLGQSPQKRLAYWSPANITAKSSKSCNLLPEKRNILIHKATNRHVSSVIQKVLSAVRVSPTLPHLRVLKPRLQVVDGNGRLLPNPHSYEKQCSVEGSSTRLCHFTTSACFYTKIT